MINLSHPLAVPAGDCDSIRQVSRYPLAAKLERRCVFRIIVTGRFGIVTAEFGNVTGHFGDVTDGLPVVQQTLH
jgi:hypothetical protein